jgi:hypothetical protein
MNMSECATHMGRREKQEGALEEIKEESEDITMRLGVQLTAKMHGGYFQQSNACQIAKFSQLLSEF